MTRLEDKILELLSTILAGRILPSIALCNEIHDELIVKYQKQLEEEV